MNFYIFKFIRKLINILPTILIIIQSFTPINNDQYSLFGYNTYFLQENQIILKIKGPGTYSVLHSDFSYKPAYISVNNNEHESFANESITLTQTESEIKLIWMSKISTCANMFKGCNSITEINLSDFDSSLVQNINYMFDGCTSLKSIYFGNFQTIRLNIMLNVFQNCKSLESLDLSSFDTSKVTDFHYMFYNCQSLKFLDLSNFNMSSCGCTRFMFSGCISLTSLNLSSFNTSKIALMQNLL